jgi:thiamin-phosphate kinase
MFENSQRTELLALGEFGLIDHLSAHFNAKLPSTALGIGDDAALIDIGEEYLAISSDCLIEGVHFDLTYTPLKHLGFKTVVVGISDIIAMNIKPQQVLINVALSNRFSLEAIEELYEGIRLACEKYNVDLIGGDTTSSRAGLMLNVTATGIGPKNHVVKRSGVQNTDLLVVTGDVTHSGSSQQSISLFHLVDRPGQNGFGFSHVGDNRMHQVGQTTIAAQFDHLRIDHQHPNFIGSSCHEYRADDRVQTNAFARSCSTGD